VNTWLTLLYVVWVPASQKQLGAGTACHRVSGWAQRVQCIKNTGMAAAIRRGGSLQGAWCA
jgi:hypothetical protein